MVPVWTLSHQNWLVRWTVQGLESGLFRLQQTGLGVQAEEMCSRGWDISHLGVAGTVHTCLHSALESVLLAQEQPCCPQRGL